MGGAMLNHPEHLHLEDSVVVLGILLSRVPVSWTLTSGAEMLSVFFLLHSSVDMERPPLSPTRLHGPQCPRTESSERFHALFLWRDAEHPARPKASRCNIRWNYSVKISLNHQSYTSDYELHSLTMSGFSRCTASVIGWW